MRTSAQASETRSATGDTDHAASPSFVGPAERTDPQMLLLQGRGEAAERARTSYVFANTAVIEPAGSVREARRRCAPLFQLRARSRAPPGRLFLPRPFGLTRDTQIRGEARMTNGAISGWMAYARGESPPARWEGQKEGRHQKGRGQAAIAEGGQKGPEAEGREKNGQGRQACPCSSTGAGNPPSAGRTSARDSGPKEGRGCQVSQDLRLV